MELSVTSVGIVFAHFFTSIWIIVTQKILKLDYLNL